MWVIIAFVMGRYAPSLVMAILAGTFALFVELAGFYAIAGRAASRDNAALGGVRVGTR